MTNPSTPSRSPNDARNDKDGSPQGDPASRSSGQQSAGGRTGQDRSMQGSQTPGHDQANQDRSASGYGNEDRGSNQALECLASALEVVIREIPRGQAAKLDSAQEHLRKAREQISASGSEQLGRSDRSDSSSSSRSDSSSKSGRQGEGGMRLDGGRSDESRSMSGNDKGGRTEPESGKGADRGNASR